MCSIFGCSPRSTVSHCLIGFGTERISTSAVPTRMWRAMETRNDPSTRRSILFTTDSLRGGEKLIEHAAGAARPFRDSLRRRDERDAEESLPSRAERRTRQYHDSFLGQKTLGEDRARKPLGKR